MATTIDARDRDVQHAFQEALTIARGATTATLSDIETSLWRALLALGRTMIALYLARVVARPHATTYVHEGATFEIAETVTSEIGTRFGKLEFERFERPVGRRVGWRRAARDRPIDRVLGLCGGFSLPTVLSVARLCAQRAFANARATFAQFCAGRRASDRRCAWSMPSAPRRGRSSKRRPRPRVTVVSVRSAAPGIPSRGPSAPMRHSGGSPDALTSRLT